MFDVAFIANPTIVRKVYAVHNDDCNGTTLFLFYYDNKWIWKFADSYMPVQTEGGC